MGVLRSRAEGATSAPRPLREATAPRTVPPVAVAADADAAADPEVQEPADYAIPVTPEVPAGNIETAAESVVRAASLSPGMSSAKFKPSGVKAELKDLKNTLAQLKEQRALAITTGQAEVERQVRADFAPEEAKLKARILQLTEQLLDAE